MADARNRLTQPHVRLQGAIAAAIAGVSRATPVPTAATTALRAWRANTRPYQDPPPAPTASPAPFRWLLQPLPRAHAAHARHTPPPPLVFCCIFVLSVLASHTFSACLPYVSTHPSMHACVHASRTRQLGWRRGRGTGVDCARQRDGQRSGVGYEEAYILACGGLVVVMACLREGNVVMLGYS